MENGHKKSLRVLVAEFLLANSAATRSAAPSMLKEAEAMLKAVVADIAWLPNINVTVLLSADAAARFADSPLWPEGDGQNIVVCQPGELQPETLPTILRDESQHAAFDAMLLIAPECDGVLVALLKAVANFAALPLLSLNLDWRLAEIFGDKHTTDVWLREHGIATISTRTIDDTTADLLRATLAPTLDIETAADIHRSIVDQLAVLKPRDGAGADSVRIVQFDQRQLSDLPQHCTDKDRWILQPFMPGVACSVGFIGGGVRGPTTILPPARQRIRVSDGGMSYHGGQIPCEPGIASRIAPVAEQIAVATGSFNGYLGADLIVDPAAPEGSAGSVRVVEINPRLCTSYVGYQALSEDNLAAWILQRHTGEALRWKKGAVTFSANGETCLTSAPTG